MGKERQDGESARVRAGWRRGLGALRGLLRSRPRLALATAAGLALLTGGGVGLWLATGLSATPHGAAASRGARAAMATAAASSASSATVAALGLPARLHAAAAAASGPLARGPVRPLGVRPTVLAPLDDAAKREAREVLAAARAGRVGASDPLVASAASAPAPPARGSTAGGSEARRVALSAPAPVWAVSTRVLRTRFESEQMLIALRAAAAQGTPGDTALRFEVLPVGSDWRAVSFPFAERRAAERLRAALDARGVRVEVVPF